MSNDFNPDSTDAMFATVLERMRAQDAKLDDILANVRKTNGRVSALERWRDVLKAKVVVVGTLTSAIVAVLAWVIERALG